MRTFIKVGGRLIATSAPGHDPFVGASTLVDWLGPFFPSKRAPGHLDSAYRTYWEGSGETRVRGVRVQPNMLGEDSFLQHAHNDKPAPGEGVADHRQAVQLQHSAYCLNNAQFATKNHGKRREEEKEGESKGEERGATGAERVSAQLASLVTKWLLSRRASASSICSSFD